MAMRIDNPLVENIMSTDVFTLGRNDKLSIADDVMSQKRIRHLPVLDADGMLCGILTQRDLFRGALLRSLGYGQRAEQKLLDSLAVKDAMRDEVVTISPKSTLSDAANLMLSKKIGCLPVVEGERLLGMISEADFVKQFAGGNA
jgi:CBS domain-containing protein